MASTSSTRADVLNSAARWKPKKAAAKTPLVRMPISRLRQGLSKVPVAHFCAPGRSEGPQAHCSPATPCGEHAAPPPSAFGHGLCVAQSMTRASK